MNPPWIFNFQFFERRSNFREGTYKISHYTMRKHHCETFFSEIVRAEIHCRAILISSYEIITIWDIFRNVLNQKFNVHTWVRHRWIARLFKHAGFYDGHRPSIRKWILVQQWAINVWNCAERVYDQPGLKDSYGSDETWRGDEIHSFGNRERVKHVGLKIG